MFNKYDDTVIKMLIKLEHQIPDHQFMNKESYFLHPLEFNHKIHIYVSYFLGTS